MSSDQPKGGLGVSLASQGFNTGAGTPGIFVQAPQFEGVENISFPTFVIGVPTTNETQINNTYYLSEGLSRVMGEHTLKVGGQFHVDQVNEHPNATFNGTFNIDGTETGDPYADFLIGVGSNYTQSSGQPFYLRNRYLGTYAHDSWRARNDLTINAGLRWDVIMPFWEKHNQIQTYVPGSGVRALPWSATRAAGRGRPRNSEDARAHKLQKLCAKNRICLLAKVRPGTPENDLRRPRQEQHSSKLRPHLHRVPGIADRNYVCGAAFRV